MRRINAMAAVVLLGVLGSAAGIADAASAYSNVVLSDNPTVYWQMDETSGATANDSAPTGGANNGTYFGVTLGVTGSPMVDNPGNTAASFDGGSSTLTASAATVGTLSPNYTAEFWFNNQRGSEGEGLINGYMFNRGSPTGSHFDAVGIDGIFTAGLLHDSLFMLAGGLLIDTHFTPTAGTWYMVALVRDAGDNVSLYVNGVAQELYEGGTNGVGATDEGTSINAPANYTADTDNSAIIMATRFDNMFFYDGDLDETAIFNSPLSASLIQAQFDHAFVTPEPASLGLLVIGVGAMLGRRRRA